MKQVVKEMGISLDDLVDEAATQNTLAKDEFTRQMFHAKYEARIGKKVGETKIKRILAQMLKDGLVECRWMAGQRAKQRAFRIVKKK